MTSKQKIAGAIAAGVVATLAGLGYTMPDWLQAMLAALGVQW
jgi:hypothetical protein